MSLPDPTRPLDEAEAADAFAMILDGHVDDADLARFLVTLAERRETVIEIVAAARALRRRQIPGPRAPDAIDVCGTGGDGRHSLNISTAVSIVVAAAGHKVAKHGNRAASSRSGATDVLAALGLPELPPERMQACLDDIGIIFLPAARHHPAMARVAPVRRALGRRTIFNLIGPLANPSGVRRQLIGVFGPRWLKPMAEALKQLGSERAMVVHGDGFDEIAVSDASRFCLLTSGLVAVGGVEPELAGLERHPSEALTGGDPAHNAAKLRALLAGEAGAYRDIVILNAAAALIVAEPAYDWPDAAKVAAAAIDGGAASDLLERWTAFR